MPTYVSQNGADFNCPHDTLKKIFERKKDDAISCNAVSNLNCPPELLKNVCRLW